MLAGPGSGPDVRTSLALLYANVLIFHERPIYLFYGDDMDETEVDSLLESLPPPVISLLQTIKLVDFLAVPEKFRKDGEIENIPWRHRWPGYQNMCRFQFLGILQQPIIRELDYYCRYFSSCSRSHA